MQIQDGAGIPAIALLGGLGVSAATTTTTTTFSLPTLLASTPVTSTKCTYSLAGNIPPANSRQNIGGHSGYMMPNNQWSMGMNPSQLNGVGAHMYGQVPVYTVPAPLVPPKLNNWNSHPFSQ